MSWSSGTNTIKEGDESKSLTLQMLELKKQGGGTEYFVRKNDVKLGTKSVTENGTYTAAADGKYGFSQFSVNVAGGNGSADSHGKPTGGDIKPGGAGSAVVGTDPETGNDVVVGVDEDENLVKTPLPSSIVLVTPPTKMDYNDGESIDLSGAVVTAKMADGTTWTDADHPNGHVSCTPEPTTADESATHQYLPTNVSQEGAILDSPEIGAGGGKTFIKFNGDPGYCTIETARSYAVHRGPVLVSLTYEGAIYDIYSSNGGFTRRVYPREVQFEGSTFYINTEYWDQSNTPITYTSDAAYLASIGARGGETNTQTITLNWARPGDGKVLSTTMEINVGTHTTESSSGTGGSGGGGTF